LAKLQGKIPEGKGANAFLFGVNGAKWAGNGKVLPGDQMQRLISGFDKPDELRAKGPTILETKYMITRADPDLLIGKNANHGFVAVKSLKAVTVILFTEPELSFAQANVAAHGFKDYLIGIKF